MRLVGLGYDHPAFVSRLTLTVETCLQFLAAGTGHGILSVACTGLIDTQLWISVAKFIPGGVSQNLVIDVLINGSGAWKSFSSRVSRDYRLHYGNKPSISRLFLLELLRTGGFFFSKWYFFQRSTTFSAPLRWLAPKPSALLYGAYTCLAFWALFRVLPDLTIISSNSFTIPKFVARLAGMTVQVGIQVQQRELASGVLKLHVPADTTAPYRYTPILTPRTIRLIRIDSTRGDTALFTLETVKLDDAPDFWALSYRWGSGDKPMVLRITSSSGQEAGCIPITPNCAAAVVALIPTGVRYLWIDTICINQADADEKALQVPLMGQIYSQASLVTGHLCTESELSFGLLIHRMVQTFANGKKYDMYSGDSFLIYRALSKLLQHDYFQRAWIVQEMVLAKSFLLIHGKDCIYFDHLMMISNAQAKNRIQPMGPDGGYLLKWLTGLPTGWKMEEWSQFNTSIFAFRERATVIEKLRLSIAKKDGSQRLTVAEIVDHNMMLGASNPRDQVYALLSLSSDSAIPQLQPNYDIMVSDKKIFTQISSYYLQNGNRLNLFLGAGLAPRLSRPKTTRTPGLPSWVFDFAYGPARELILGNWVADIERKRPVRLTCRLTSEYLSVWGTIIDKVAFVASQPIHESDMTFSATAFLAKTTVSILDETKAMVQKSVPDPYPGEVDRDEAYWRTMLMDCYVAQTPAPSGAKDMFLRICDFTREMHTNPQSQLLDFSILDRGVAEQRTRSGTDSIVDSMTKIWMPYTFVVLDSGYMGWSPPGVQVGDVFCLFEGCIVPFVLRPSGDGDTFTLWGDGYVHGFMPGQKPGIDGRTEEWFNLI
jgi:hypothetical protein